MAELPPGVIREARRLQEAVRERREAHARHDAEAYARATAREEALAGWLLEALEEAAVAHRAGDFEGLHPRDRLGRFMEKLDSELHAALLRASRVRTGRRLARDDRRLERRALRAQRHGRELASLGGLLPHSQVPGPGALGSRALRASAEQPVPLTRGAKVKALVASGLAASADEARELLLDLGE
jgi:hypothetical protein